MSRHFFIVGAQRSGTSYMHKLMGEHPQIEMIEPCLPEPKFFLQPDSEKRIDEYLRKFNSQETTLVRGEKTVSYMERPEVAGRLARCFPDALIVFILRDPIDRAISNYWYSSTNGLDDKDIDDALTDESYQDRPYDKQRITGCPPFDYLKRGRYINYIETYLEHFDLRQIRILIHENFIGNPEAVSDLYKFLGVNPDIVPLSINEKVHAYSPEDQEHISAKTERFLCDYYRPWNDALAAKFALDISQWRSQKPCTLLS